MSVGLDRKVFWLLAVVGSAACVFGAMVQPKSFFPGYLQAYGYWMALSLGSLGLFIIHGLTGGEWGRVLSPFLRAGIRTVPLAIILFVPIILGASHLYSWSDPAFVESHALLVAKKAYLNMPFFLVRAGFYFLVWLALALFVTRGKLNQGKSGISLVLLILTMSFAAFDWFMSLEPEWFSSLYGGIFAVGAVVSTFAFAVVVHSKTRPDLDRRVFHDLGKFVFMSVMLWAYLNFSQYLIIWSGNLPEEMTWYHHRMVGGWNWVGLALVLGLFVIPFCALLSQRAKKNTRILMVVGIGLLTMRWVDFYWLVQPAFRESVMAFPLWEVVAFLAVGGIWLSCFTAFATATDVAKGPVPEEKIVIQKSSSESEKERYDGPQDR